jgi:diguanylate cyclase (GGDEF)-like protein
MVNHRNFWRDTRKSDWVAVTPHALLGRLRVRAKLYLAFSVISGLVIVSAIAAVAWTSHTDAEMFRNLSQAGFVERQSTAVELELMTMSDAMRGYLLDPTSQTEVRRKFAADDALSKLVEDLKTSLAGMPAVLRRIAEIETYDDQILNESENRLVKLAGEDVEAAKRFYQTGYLPQRQHEIEMIGALRDEVVRVKATVRVKANETYVTHIVLGLFGTAVILIVSWLLAWFSARVIGDQLRAMTAAMGNLADGDTTIEIPAQDNKDEIGDMARAMEVFRANLIGRREGEVTLRNTNLLFDAALNSMTQGMIVWGDDHRVQLVNRRFFDIFCIPKDSVVPGLTVAEVIAIQIFHGLHPGQEPADVVAQVTSLVTARQSVRLEMEMRSGLFIQVMAEPMADGGAVITFEDVSEKRRDEARITFMAGHDALTGLPNRSAFQQHTEAMLGEQGNDKAFALLCLDLDHFKEVNDTIGHPAGDELLRLVAGRLRHCVRGQDLIARLGGDEFSIIIACPVGDLAPATLLATRLVDAIGSPYDIQGHSIVIGVSIGIAFSEPGVSAADLLKRADVALYRAKEERGTFAFFEPGMDEHLQARRGMEADLRLALHRNEFELNYQPLYNLAEDRVTAFEALIRWNSPTRGRVAPDQFIPLTEQTGMIVQIGEWVLRTACAEAVAWPDHVRVAVNLSAVQTKNKNLVALIRETLEQTGLPAHRLELEITETVLLQDTETVMRMLHSLHDLGVRVSMDDFGTGYSSLSYLRRFPFDKIKIDRSFISDLRGSPGRVQQAGGTQDALSAAAVSAATIVRAIIGLGHSLGMSTTAEGVETAQQFVQVREKGCTEVQGYFISPARPANEVAALMQRLDKTLPAIANSPSASPQLVA